MVKTVWISLVSAFLVYTIYIYYSSYGKTVSEADAKVKEGWDIWQNKNCQACHQLYGLGGYMGPDLTNTYSVLGPDYMKAMMKSGTNRMPDFKLTEIEIDNIVSFLKWVDESGKNNVANENLHWTGTYIINKYEQD